MDILIVTSANTNKLVQVSLPRPKDGKLQNLFYDEENIVLYEITKYHDQYRSWFLDNKLSKDGHLNILTKIDPLYLFIPHLIKLAGDRFRTLHDICSTYASQLDSSTDGSGGSKIDYALSPDIKWEYVCDTKELDDELFVKYSQSKTLDWLLAKHGRTVEALKGELDSQPSIATLNSYAFDLIDLYLSPTLSEKLKDLVRSKPIGVDIRGEQKSTTLTSSSSERQSMFAGKSQVNKKDKELPPKKKATVGVMDRFVTRGRKD